MEAIFPEGRSVLRSGRKRNRRIRLIDILSFRGDENWRTLPYLAAAVFLRTTTVLLHNTVIPTQ
jgi:hypothetical protein